MCDPSSKEVPVRILNPSTHDVLLNKGTVVGLATEVEEEVSFLQRENEEYDNTGCVKTVQTTEELSWPDNSDITDKEAKLSSVPDHLKDLFQSSCENLNEDERTKLADVLNDYQSAFANNRMDLGKTDVVEHLIDTGVHRPIKHRLRRTPVTRGGGGGGGGKY